jgi:hypothetical protein
VNLSIPLTAQDIILAAGAALALTWLINALSRLFRSVVNRSTEFDYTPQTRDFMLEKCYALFPTEYLRFNDELFKRGMQVRVFTYRNKQIEGQFIGVNDDNMICVMTQRRVVAQELTMIEEIEAL